MLTHLFHSFESHVAGAALIKYTFSMYYLKVLHHLLNPSEFCSAAFTEVLFEDIHGFLKPYVMLFVPTFSA
jgi:hypothetical protein